MVLVLVLLGKLFSRIVTTCVNVVEGTGAPNLVDIVFILVYVRLKLFYHLVGNTLMSELQKVLTF